MENSSSLRLPAFLAAILLGSLVACFASGVDDDSAKESDLTDQEARKKGDAGDEGCPWPSYDGGGADVLAWGGDASDSGYWGPRFDASADAGK